MPPVVGADGQLKAERAERANIIKDIKDGVIRAAVVPCCYSLEEFMLGLCHFPEFRFKNLKLLEEEIGYGADKMKLTSKRILAAYFTPNPQLFMDIFGFPLADLNPDGLLSVRPWHDDTIAVMALHKNPGTHKLSFNAIMRETLAQEHKNKLSWQGNCLMLSSSLQSDIHRDLGGVTRFAVIPALQDKLKARGAADEVEARWRHAGVDLQTQFGWLADLPTPPLSQPSPAAPLQQQLEFMVRGWKMQRCLLPHKHTLEKCPGYHVIQYKPNSNTPIFDARRSPLKAGQLQYQAVHCKDRLDTPVHELHSSHYCSCAAGAACDKAHSLVELFYNPEHFKRQACDALRGGKCSNSESGMPQHTCAFLHSAAEQEAMHAIMKHIAPQVNLPASADIAGLMAASSSARISRAASSTASSSRAAGADTEASSSRGPAALDRSASRASSHGDSAYVLQGPAAAVSSAQQPPTLGDMEAFPGLTSSKTSKLANSASTTLQQQQQQVVAAATASRPMSLSQQGAAAPPAGTSASTSLAPARAPQVQEHSAVHDNSVEDAEGRMCMPRSYDEVDPDTVSFLFQGPASNTAVQLQWYYIDPYGQIQGPFTPHEMIDWCMNELLPIHLLVYPAQLGETAPSKTSAFWPLNELLFYAAESLSSTGVDESWEAADETAAAATGASQQDDLAAVGCRPQAVLPAPPVAYTSTVPSAGPTAPARVSAAVPAAPPTPAATAAGPSSGSSSSSSAHASAQSSAARRSILQVDAKPFELRASSSSSAAKQPWLVPLSQPGASTAETVSLAAPTAGASAAAAIPPVSGALSAAAAAAAATHTGSQVAQREMQRHSALMPQVLVSEATAATPATVAVVPAAAPTKTALQEAQGPNVQGFSALLPQRRTSETAAAAPATAAGAASATQAATQAAGAATPAAVAAAAAARAAMVAAVAAPAAVAAAAATRAAMAQAAAPAAGHVRSKGLKVDAPPFEFKGYTSVVSPVSRPDPTEPATGGASQAVSVSTAAAGSSSQGQLAPTASSYSPLRKSVTAVGMPGISGSDTAAPRTAPTAAAEGHTSSQPAAGSKRLKLSVTSPPFVPGRSASDSASSSTTTTPKELAPASSNAGLPSSNSTADASHADTSQAVADMPTSARRFSEATSTFAATAAASERPEDAHEDSRQADYASAGGSSSLRLGDQSAPGSGEAGALTASGSSSELVVATSATATAEHAASTPAADNDDDGGDGSWHVVQHKHLKRHKGAAAAATTQQVTAAPSAAAGASGGCQLPMLMRPQGPAAAKAKWADLVDEEEAEQEGLDHHLQQLSATGDSSSYNQSEAAAACITGSSAAAEQRHQQQQAGQVRITVQIYDMQSATLHEPTQMISTLLSGTTTVSDICAHIQESVQAAAADIGGCRSVLMLAVRRCDKWPHPQMVLLQRKKQQLQLHELCGASQNELGVEVYCSTTHDLSILKTASGTEQLPVFYQYVLVTRDFSDSLWRVVCGDAAPQASAAEREQQHKALMQHLCKVFDAALSQGLLWHHDPDWAVFNSGLPRDQTASQPQILFLRRNRWPPSEGVPSRPWVATKKLLSLSEAAVWLKGSQNIPPSPAGQHWPGIAAATKSTSSGSSYTDGSSAAAAMTQQVEVGRADREPVWRRRSDTAGDTTSKEQQDRDGHASAAAGAALIEPDGETVTPESLPGTRLDQQPQQRQQQQDMEKEEKQPTRPLYWPASSHLQNNSSVLSAESSGLAVGSYAGVYRSAHPADSSSVQLNNSSSDSVSVGEPVLCGLSAYPGTPLLTVPVLPAMPGTAAAAAGGTPAGSSAAQQATEPPAASAATSTGPVHQQGVSYYRDLSQGHLGLQMALDCKMQQQQPVGGVGVSFKLLVSQRTPAEEVAAAVAQWMSERDREQQVPGGPESSTSTSSSKRQLAPVLLAYQQADSSNGATTWRLLQYDKLLQCDPLRQPSATSSSGRSAPCNAVVLHPLETQMIFAAVPTTLTVQVLAVAESANVSSLFAICTGSLSSQLADVHKLAAAEYWGQHHLMLQHYLADNFMRAAWQGRLFVKTSSTAGTSSSNGGTKRSVSSSPGPAMQLPGAVGLLAMRVQQQQQQQEVQQERLLLFNTGLYTEADQQVLVIFSSPCTSASRSSSPWKYHTTVTSFQGSALHPLPTPAAAPTVPFNPSIPVHLDLDALLNSVAAQQSLAQHLQYQGQALPQAAWHSLLQGALTNTLMQLQRTPGLALQLLAGERLLYVLPLFVFRGAPVQLVVLVEQLAANCAGSRGALYGGGCLTSFAEVYKHVRALGKVTWVSWVQQAVAALMPDEAHATTRDTCRAV